MEKIAISGHQIGNLTETYRDSLKCMAPFAILSYPHTLPELWEHEMLILPHACSDKQLQVMTFLSSLKISNDVDILEWCRGNILRTRFSTSEVYNLIQNSSPLVSWKKRGMVIWKNS